MHDNGGLYKGNRDGDETWLSKTYFKTVLKNILVHWGGGIGACEDDDRKTAIKMGRFEEKGLTSPIT